MARLASKQRLGFYPTPPLVCDAIARLLSALSRDALFRLLDPCAGDGKALARIRQRLQEQHTQRHGRYADFHVSTWGIEVDAVRAQQAERLLDHVIQSNFFKSTLSSGEASDRGWQCVYLNPPYDTGLEDMEGKQAGLGFQFLRRATDRLCSFGIMIWVIPQRVLCQPDVARFLAEHYDQHTCYRFPDTPWQPPGENSTVSMYDQFKQIVWIGRKRPKAVPAETNLSAQITAWGHLGRDLLTLPLEGGDEHQPYAIPNAPTDEVKYFLKGSFDPDAAAAFVSRFDRKTRRPLVGVWANGDYWRDRFPDPRTVGLSVGHPVHAFKQGYLVVFSVAGIVNRVVLTGNNGRRVLVKGHTRKVVHTTSSDDGIEIIDKETERFESSLWCTDLDTMELILVETGQGMAVDWPVEHERMSMKDFLDIFGDSLMEQVMHLNAPRYHDPHQVPWAQQAFAQLLRKPLGKQLHVILAQAHAFVNRWRDGGPDEDERLSRLAEVAEMAAGKTYMAMATAFLADLHASGCVDQAREGTRIASMFPALVFSPPIMAPKWKRELEATLPNARVLIVERFGPTRGTHRDEEDQDDGTDAITPSSTDAREAFRQFDPEFTGTSLGLVGSVDHAVARIKRDLTEWRQQYDRVVAENRRIRAAIAAGQATEADLQPLPLKPCHVLILTFSAAKMMPPWMPRYRLKPLRLIDKTTGKVRLLRRGEEKSPALVPACSHCFRPLKDERIAKRLRKTNSDVAMRLDGLGQIREERREEGLRLGHALLAQEERIQQYLLSLESYCVLAQEREVLSRGEIPSDALYQAHVQRMNAFLDQLCKTSATYDALLRERDEAYRQGKPQEVLACEQRISRFLNDLLLTDEQYRVLIIQQDQRFRELQLACEERVERFLEHLAETDTDYQVLLTEMEQLREQRARHVYRLEAHEEEAVESVSQYLTEKELEGTRDYRVKHTCVECGEPAWQYVPKQAKNGNWRPESVLDYGPIKQVSKIFGATLLQQYVGSSHAATLPLPSERWKPPCVSSTYQRRYALADYIADQYPNVFGLLIADEVHEGADGTALDQARQILAGACRYMLGLTGTLSNGYASSLFRLYYLIMRQIRREFGYDEVKRWIRLHGKMQRVQKSRYETPPTGTGSDSKRKILPGMPVYKEIAGFDPSGMGRIARVSTFTELRDVVSNLVDFKEKIHTVSMGPLLGPAYKQFQEETTWALRKLLATGDASGLSAWFQALLIYPDMPWLGFECRTKYGALLGVAPVLPEDQVYPIEEAILAYVQKQHLAGHPVLLYTERTGTYDEQPRLKALLERYVRRHDGKKLKVAILRHNTTRKTMDREAWLERQVREGIDVLICNPALVKVGLDLLHFTRIAYKSFPRRTSDMRQSSRRSLRPGQTRDIEVAYFAYEEAMALRLLYLMARKALASLMVEGKIASEGLVSLGVQEEEEEGDLVGRLAREMVRALEDGTLNDTTKIAEELQEMALSSAQIEREQNHVLGEEEEASELLLEAIRREPLSLPSPIDEAPIATPAAREDVAVVDVTPPEPSGPMVSASPTPTAVPGNALSVPPVQNAPETIATNQPEEEKYVTIIPISVTENPLMPAIVAQAGVDIWATLREQFGVTGKKARRRRT